MAGEIEKVAVLGAGIMGSGIAAHLANAGIPTVLLDIVPPDLSEEEKKVKKHRDRFARSAIEKAVKTKGNIRPFFKASLASLIETGNFDDDMDRIADCDWIVEAIIERLDIKRSLFDRVLNHRKPGAILSSNTSGIKIAEMMEGFPKELQQHFLITHFFNPPRYLRLLELVPGEKTLPEVMEKMARFGAETLGKGIVYGKDTPNFVANRVGVMGVMGAMKAMIDDGLTVEEVDVITGPPMGHPKSATFRTADLVGLDTLGHLLRNSYEALPDDEWRDRYQAPEWLEKMIEKGLLGEKSKQGFYRVEKTAEGKKILQLDVGSMEYKPTEKPRFESVGKCKDIDDPGERIKTLVGAEDKAGQFAWKLIADGGAYAARRLGEIADDIVQIDNGMRWGFAWELGPFEIWDAIGVKDSIARMEAEGREIPEAARAVAEKGEGTWYKVEQGKRLYWDHKDETYKPVPTTDADLSLKLLKSAGKTLKKNLSASLIDIGDGVLCFEFHAKMNAIDDDIIKLMNQSVDLLEEKDEWIGMVIGNQAENFSVGANLGLIMMLAMGKQFDQLEEIVRRFQDANQRIKYCRKPVVAAPFGMTLGGGCEMAMGADAMCVAGELYMGQVEVGAGIIPGGGGTKESLVRHLEHIPAEWEVDRFPYIQKVFENIGMAAVSTSALEARDLKYVRNTDKLVMNRDHRLYEAKRLVRGMWEAGYRPPRGPDCLVLPGKPGFSTLQMGLYNMRLSNFVTDHELKIGTKLAHVLTGGDIQPNTKVTEQYVLDLEREAFMSLVGEPKTIERMQALLTTGRPLRN